MESCGLTAESLIGQATASCVIMQGKTQGKSNTGACAVLVKRIDLLLCNKGLTKITIR